MTVEEEMAGGEGGGYHSYPAPLATYDHVVTSRDLFMDTLKKLHLSMATKFMIPIVGGRDLDLHRLFVEVTSRGGITKVLNNKKWKEVTGVFNFPSSATNASFILRKYYISLIYHYEQIYFFKARRWTPSPTDTMQTLSTITAPSHGLPQYAQQIDAATAEMSAPQEGPSGGPPVCGVIDGKFDSGYLVTVKIGSEDFKGVLYQVPNSETRIFQDQRAESNKLIHYTSPKPCVTRRKRRKKSEIRKRDPSHPKPNRSGYNFFFAEQHARLKPHYHGRDREISRIIGESWNKLQEPERAVYQEKALKDKERYRTEMEAYRERSRAGEITGTTTVPIQLNPPMPQLNSTDNNSNIQVEGATTSAYTEENETSDKSNLEGYESAENGNECLEADTELKNVNIEVVPDEAFDLQTRPNELGDDHTVLAEDGISVPIDQGMEQQPSNNGNESIARL